MAPTSTGRQGQDRAAEVAEADPVPADPEKVADPEKDVDLEKDVDPEKDVDRTADRRTADPTNTVDPVDTVADPAVAVVAVEDEPNAATSEQRSCCCSPRNRCTATS